MALRQAVLRSIRHSCSSNSVVVAGAQAALRQGWRSSVAHESPAIRPHGSGSASSSTRWTSLASSWNPIASFFLRLPTGPELATQHSLQPRDDVRRLVTEVAASTPETTGIYCDRTLPVFNFQLQETGASATLPGAIFDVPLRPDICHRVVVWQLAKRRQGTHSTKRAKEISLTGRKPWKQKGTGQARAGNLKAPQHRGGATMHGPKPRDYEFSLFKKVRRLGLKVALSSRAAEGKLLLLDDLAPPAVNTQFMARFVAQLGCKKVLLVDGEWAPDTKLAKSTANLFYANVLPAGGLNVYSILQHDHLILSLNALRMLESRLLSI
eukprot:TRINITY_DN17092_c0_g1_i1.p1 TRINITY_DN17092_c0_g1~~TRINITY_DN17092_c0_g1_i1.p1  ORF type:complete len:324 (-),score=52.87 TRINITY_DN17092_c0_g1_i1:1064-2035(-)